MEPQEYDEIIRHLVRIAAHQDTINADLRESIQDLREFNRQQVDINRDVKTTLARVETLLARMIRHQDNGQDA